MARGLKFGVQKVEGLYYVKTKAQISFTVTAKLICVFVFAYAKSRYSLDIMRQTASLVFNPIMVEGYAALFSCTAVVQASDSMTASM